MYVSECKNKADVDNVNLTEPYRSHTEWRFAGLIPALIQCLCRCFQKSFLGYVQRFRLFIYCQVVGFKTSVDSFAEYVHPFPLVPTKQGGCSCTAS